MKLAEALQERADLNRKIEQLRSRLNSNALVQEGESPAEDPQLLKEQLDAAIARLTDLMGRINLTNSATRVEGRTLTELIARKDALTLKLSVYRDMVYAGSQGAYRARNTEIRITPTISVPEWQSETDRMARELRLLDNTLQATNWQTELMELRKADSRPGANVTRRQRKSYETVIGAPKSRCGGGESPRIVMLQPRTTAQSSRIVITGH